MNSLVICDCFKIERKKEKLTSRVQRRSHGGGGGLKVFRVILERSGLLYL